MEINKKIFAIPLVVFISLFAMSSANANYTLCDQSQIETAKKLLNLKFETDDNYHSCLVINESEQKILFANSNVVKSDEDGEVKTFDLTTYLIDGKKNQLLHTQMLDKNIPSDAMAFEGINFDITPFSTLNDKTVVGILKNFHHSGFFSFAEDDLLLLNVNNQKISSIGEIPIYQSNSMNGNTNCGLGNGGHSSEVKRLLILSNHANNGFQDIIIKATKFNEGRGGKGCKYSSQQWHDQSVIKFDGKQYQIKLDKLEPDGM